MLRPHTFFESQATTPTMIAKFVYSLPDSLALRAIARRAENFKFAKSQTLSDGLDTLKDFPFNPIVRFTKLLFRWSKKLFGTGYRRLYSPVTENKSRSRRAIFLSPCPDLPKISIFYRGFWFIDPKLCFTTRTLKNIKNKKFDGSSALTVSFINQMFCAQRLILNLGQYFPCFFLFGSDRSKKKYGGFSSDPP